MPAIKCPACHDGKMAVKDSRPIHDEQQIRRRRQCTTCGARMTTYEGTAPPITPERDAVQQLIDEHGMAELLLAAKIVKAVRERLERQIAKSRIERDQHHEDH